MIQDNLSKYLKRQQGHRRTLLDLETGPDSTGSQEKLGNTLDEVVQASQHDGTRKASSVATVDTDQNLLLTTKGTRGKAPLRQ